jgi:alkylation response protein AidB-like acyl-CoA dehydrogenase
MQIELDTQARQWQRKAADFATRELIPWELHAEMHGGTLPEDVRQRHRRMARELGFSAMDAPAEHGGAGARMVDQVAVWEQLGRVTNALCWCFSEAQHWMFQACSDDQLRRYILPLMDGSRIECYAITESGPGSAVSGIQATAHADGTGYRINGEKWYVTSANHADYIIFQARLADGPNADQHALFFIDKNTPGIEEIANPPFSHTFAAHHPTLRFTDVHVPVDNRIGAEGDGMAFTHSWFRHERLMISARCCGAAGRLIEEASEFAKTRMIDGEALADKQLIQAMLADSVTDLWAAQLMTYETAAAHDRNLDVKTLHARCSVTKLFASEMANRVADRALQIFGGRGYMRENAAERFFRELRVDRIWEGTSEIQRLIIARALLKRGFKDM